MAHNDVLSCVEDPLLCHNPHRFVLFPIQYHAVWEMYNKHVASFWTVEEVDLSQDMAHWNKLTDNEQHSHYMASHTDTRSRSACKLVRTRHI